MAETISDSHQDLKRGTIPVRTVISCPGTVQDTTLKVSEKLKEKIYHHATNIGKALEGFQQEKVNQELQKYIKNSMFEFKQSTSIEGEEQPPKLTELDVANLRFVHVKKELEILRQEKVIKELNTKINEMKAFVLVSMFFVFGKFYAPYKMYLKLIG